MKTNPYKIGDRVSIKYPFPDHAHLWGIVGIVTGLNEEGYIIEYNRDKVVNCQWHELTIYPKASFIFV